MSLLQCNWWPDIQINWQQSVFSGALCCVQHRRSKVETTFDWTPAGYWISHPQQSLLSNKVVNAHKQQLCKWIISGPELQTRKNLSCSLYGNWTNPASCWTLRAYTLSSPTSLVNSFPRQGLDPSDKNIISCKTFLLGCGEALLWGKSFMFRIRRSAFLKNLSTHPKSTLLHFNMTSFTVRVGSFTTCRINIVCVI